MKQWPLVWSVAAEYGISEEEAKQVILSALLEEDLLAELMTRMSESEKAELLLLLEKAK